MWGSTWHQKFVQNRPSPILMKFLPDASLVMDSILAKFEDLFSSSSCFFRSTKKAAKIASKSIFSEKMRVAKMYEDNENKSSNFARILSMTSDASGKNFIKIGDGRFWTNFWCHVLPHMVKPHFWAHFGLKLALCSGYPT
ncbi:hypothetical protein B9Z55_028301 [Caenorhabditis nigoni]|uniref:Uncharacterized protein n=1 Tax=Caenorhabditis nigoni TaxID=1611254 RepID=A0A2G5SC92_9PELO|nr:hypothetical protein B9Z55_028301 [Caenorhabditis nigoni]